MLAMVWVRWLHTCLHNIATNSHLQKIIANIHAYIIQPKTSCCHQNKEISLFSGQNFGLTRLGGRQTDGTKQRCSVGWLPADTESDRAEVPPRNPLLLTTIFYVFFNGSIALRPHNLRYLLRAGRDDVLASRSKASPHRPRGRGVTSAFWASIYERNTSFIRVW
jgi:hypothetical protein